MYFVVVLMFTGIASGVELDNVTNVESTTVEMNSTESVEASTEESSTAAIETCDTNSTLCKTNITTMITNMTKLQNNQTDDLRHDDRRFNWDYKISNKKTCLCDLQRHYCNINCCCDKDCSFNDKLVFNSCDDQHDLKYDTNFCKYTQYLYKNNTQYEWEVTQNSLFCIEKSNLPKQYLSETKQIIKDVDDAKIRLKNKSVWPNIEKKDKLGKQDIDFMSDLVYGSPVWLKTKNLNLNALELPINYLTHACNMKHRIKFLQDFKSECFQSTINTENIYLNMETYYKNVTFISKLKALNLSKPAFEGCPKNVCIALNINICNDDFEICKNVTTNITNLKTICYTKSTEGKSCLNLVNKARYTIYHNATDGIKQIKLDFVLNNVNLKNDTFNLKQYFEVKFVWHNYTLNYSDNLSGNPGYIIGKPILISNLIVKHSITTNSTTNQTVVVKNETMQRKHGDFTSHFMVFPLNNRGDCVLTNTHNLPVEFGYNMITKCKMKGSVKSQKNITASELCKIIQNEIFSYWSMKYVFINNTFVNKTVGKFGNANINNKQDWSQILYEQYPNEILNNTNGTFRNNHAICNNLTTTMKAHIFHAREIYEDLTNQEKIIAVYVDFGNSIAFRFQNKNGVYSYEIPIRSEALFYDVTKEKVKKFVGPPTFELKLPYDFFYPFIKVENKAGVSCSSHFLICGFIVFQIFF